LPLTGRQFIQKNTKQIFLTPIKGRPTEITPEEIEKHTDELARRSAKPNNPEVKGKLDHWVAPGRSCDPNEVTGKNVYLKHWRSTKNDDRRTTMTIR